MRIQLALDTLSLDGAVSLVQRVHDYIDIIEAGTPFILEYGMSAVRVLRENFPAKQILADTKIMDAGELEAASAFMAGADYATVLAVTDIATVRACVETANHHDKKIVADMICVSDMKAKIAELEALKVHGLAVHTGVDQQRAGRTPLEDLRLMKKCAVASEISAAGGITLKTLPDYAALKPDIVIIGGGICNATDPVSEAAKIHEYVQKEVKDFAG